MSVPTTDIVQTVAGRANVVQLFDIAVGFGAAWATYVKRR